MKFLTWLMILILSITIFTIHVHDVGDTASQGKGVGEDAYDKKKRAITETEYTDKTDYWSWWTCGDIGYADDDTGVEGYCVCKENVTTPDQGTYCCVPPGGGQCWNIQLHGLCPFGETTVLADKICSNISEPFFGLQGWPH